MKLMTVMAAAVLGVTAAAFGRTNVVHGANATITTAPAAGTTITTTGTTIIPNGTAVSPAGLGFAVRTNTTIVIPGTTGTPVTTTGGTLAVSQTFDQQFLNRAVIDSEQEILLGSVAETNSQNADIQAFGQQLVTDHTAAIEQAQAVAANLGITLPTAGGAAGVPQRLLTLTGTQFDQQFIAFMIQSHIQDINLYEMAALRARNADVRAFARDQLPVLMNHLVTALGIRENLATGTVTGAGAGTNTVTNTNTTTNTNTGTDP